MFEKIYSSSLKFLFPLSPAATYKTVVNEAVQLVGGKYGSLFLERSGRLKRMHASDPILYKIKPREHGVTQTVYETGKMIIRASSKLIESHSWFKNAKIGDDLNLPLTYNGITLGVLSIIAKPNKKFTKSQVETLKLFSPLAMIAIRKALLHEELQKAFDSRELFISLAAHELKAPLTVVYTETQLIAKSLKNNHHISQEKIQRLLSAEMRLNKLFLTSSMLTVSKSAPLTTSLKKKT
ncbi:MAG: GAF domain-containing protein [Candidatus Shapirobacteria bacterium]|jgi:transcriptional regulator with GAF, ATPase, and Fis domain